MKGEIAKASDFVVSALVFKAAPLKDDSKTMADLGLKTNDTLIVTFKKGASAPPPSAAPANGSVSDSKSDAQPVSAPSTSSSSESSTPATGPSSSSTSSAPSSTPAPSTDLLSQCEWQCPACTYINIPARTVCEVCETRNPNRPLPAPRASPAPSGGAAGGGSGSAGSDSGDGSGAAMDSDYMMAMALQRQLGGDAGGDFGGLFGAGEDMFGMDDEDDDPLGPGIELVHLLAASANDSALQNRIAQATGLSVNDVQGFATRAARDFQADAANVDVDGALSFLQTETGQQLVQTLRSPDGAQAFDQMLTLLAAAGNDEDEDEDDIIDDDIEMD